MRFFRGYLAIFLFYHVFLPILRRFRVVLANCCTKILIKTIPPPHLLRLDNV
jgi:hypothetical protein